MSLTLQKNYAAGFTVKNITVSPWKRFIAWADGQEEHRFGWTAVGIAGHGCVFTVLTIMAIVLSGNNFILWPFAIAAMSACLITNLAAMPTRIIIPVLFASVVIDLIIVAICIASGINMGGIYA